MGLKMGRRGRTSIVREVKESLQAIDKIGQSKREARKNDATGIHSVKQMENAMSDCQNYVKWVRAELGVKSIIDLTAEHYARYIAYLGQKGLSKGHMRNVETSLRLLEKGFARRLERNEGENSRFAGFCPAKRLVTVKTGEDVRNRAYNEGEIELIREHCSPEVRKAVDLMYGLGLRVREAVNVRAEHFVQVDGRWRLQIGNGSGITKGGRYRHLPVPDAFAPKLEAMLIGRKMNDRLLVITSTTVRDGVNVACKKAKIAQGGRGCHGFRHAYARNRMDQLAAPEQKQMMERILSNREIGRKADYSIISEHDKHVYQTTKNVMDTIHEELGHGKNRWALAMRYLR